MDAKLGPISTSNPSVGYSYSAGNTLDLSGAFSDPTDHMSDLMALFEGQQQPLPKRQMLHTDSTIVPNKTTNQPFCAVVKKCPTEKSSNNANVQTRLVGSLV